MLDRAPLSLWQLISPTLPVGGFNYSEGIEWLVEAGTITNAATLQAWLTQELTHGSIRVETAIMARAYHLASTDPDHGSTATTLQDWNQWLTASRETQELRQQSLQMGRSLRKLLIDLTPEMAPWFDVIGITEPCHYAIAFGIGAAVWHIALEQSTLGYLYGWVNNLISAGVRLVPLGQTDGQRILFALQSTLQDQTAQILTLTDDDLYSCSWGLGLASMGHETQYTRLFRS
jgi:urease accessory protein